MKLRVKDVADLLQVSDKTIYRWIARRSLPVYRVNEQYRFNRAELIEWATAQRIPISPKILEEPEDVFIPSLEEALRTGGPSARTIHYMETVAGDTTIGHCTAYCRLIEALSGAATPARAEAIRAVAAELERIANHIGDLGALAGDVGFLPTMRV